MREIKFRVWNKKRNKMIYKPEIDDDIEEGYAIKNNGELIKYADMDYYPSIEELNDDNFKLMQYTGRMDKNQKEIYKNDILKFVYDNLRFKGIVRYNKNKAQYIIYCEDGKFGFDIIQKVKVIGNNYENPELLE